MAGRDEARRARDVLELYNSPEGERKKRKENLFSLGKIMNKAKKDAQKREKLTGINLLPRFFFLVLFRMGLV